MSTAEKPGDESKYAKKKASGKQLYGPGCCAHSVTPAEIVRAQRHANYFRRGRPEVSINVPDHDEKCECRA